MKPATPRSLTDDILSSYRQERELEKLAQEAKAAHERSGLRYWQKRVEEYTQRKNELIRYRDTAQTVLDGTSVWAKRFAPDKQVSTYAER